MKEDKSLAATSDDFRFAAAVAGFGMLLRQHDRATQPAGLTYPMLQELAKNSRGKDPDGYRAEFIRLLESAEMLHKYPRQPTTN
jgi:Ca-activated chloride channel family protein